VYFRHCQSKFKFNTLPSRIISHVKLIEGEVWHSASYETRFYAVPLQAGQRHHDIRITQFRSLSGHLNNSSNRIHWETDYVTTAKFTVLSLASCLIVGWLFRRHTSLFFFVPDDIENRWYSNSPSQDTIQMHKGNCEACWFIRRQRHRRRNPIRDHPILTGVNWLDTMVADSKLSWDYNLEAEP